MPSGIPYRLRRKDADLDEIEAQYPSSRVLPETHEGSGASDDGANKKRKTKELATVRQVFSFGTGPRKKLGLMLGIFCSVLTGCVFPSLAFIMSNTFRTLSAPTEGGDFLGNIRTMALIFVGLGVFALLSMTAQNTLLETAASEMTYSLKTQWFDALLRQDMAYFDIKDVSGTATLISAAGTKFNMGVGRKLGEGIQFFVTFLGGFIYAFYASWKASLVLLGAVPIMSASILFFVKMNQSQTKRANEGYAKAGAVAYQAASAIRTVFSLNLCETMIKKYVDATESAYRAAARRAPLLGLANGLMIGSVQSLRNVVLTLYGAYLLYDQVRSSGCDPSGNLGDINPSGTCDPDGADLMGAMLGIMMGAAGIPQLSVALEAFTNARAACYPALAVMNRRVDNDEDVLSLSATCAADVERNSNGEASPLPKYAIDSSSQEGIMPTSINGDIEFQNVSFQYPSRREAFVFEQFSLSIKAGQTVALVGQSGCGKSTAISLLERFYDPSFGSIRLDGVDIRELNIKWLRQRIGLVSQEPVLFAKTIRENIAYGWPSATQEEIEEAARCANAHNFICEFPDGYDTLVGEGGSKLSGGQKQRVALSRAMLKRPQILLLDEATSALDSESEHVVQAALDELLQSQNMTTIVIAHRLSTVINADLIAVVDGGRVVEKGTHDSLLDLKGHYYKLCEAQNVVTDHRLSSSLRKSSARSNIDESDNELTDSRHSSVNGSNGPVQLAMRNVHFHYPTRPSAKIFRGLNISIRRGETLALVGPSGEGKSTIVSLIERYYDPTSGSIYFDGIDLRDLNVKWLRDQIGLVSQEPTLFDVSIGQNIAYGRPDCTQEDIEEAARRANAHDFICEFPDGYDTLVGEAGSQLSGGQKQRVALSRAILKQPQLLILDEATSALDSESERIVQNAVDELMFSSSQTAIVIAHRLSTLRNADRVAVIADGKVVEIGTHEELMSKPHGRFKRMSMFQSLDGNSANVKVTMAAAARAIEEEEKKTDEEGQLDERESEWDNEDEGSIEATEKQHIRRARLLAKDDAFFFFIGAIGALLAGLTFPAMGVLMGYMIELLYKLVPGCDIPGLPTCEDVANDMQSLSFRLTYGWLGVLFSGVIGNVLLFYGFGTASECMNKRIRDSAFRSLIRQEVAFFDSHAVGVITSQLQDDAAMIHAFSGEPLRAVVVSISSLLVGLVISFVFMWPFAIVMLLVLPFLAFGAKAKAKMFYTGDDEVTAADDENSPAGIVVESLLNIRTVASLTIEETRSKEFSEALRKEDPTPLKSRVVRGLMAGLGQFTQFSGMALLFWWGGWLLSHYPGVWSFRDFLISMFALMISISGMATGSQSATDKDDAKRAARRIFHLIDRQSAIDPLSEAGMKGV